MKSVPLLVKSSNIGALRAITVKTTTNVMEYIIVMNELTAFLLVLLTYAGMITVVTPVVMNANTNVAIFKA